VGYTVLAFAGLTAKVALVKSARKVRRDPSWS